jgi:hypothetical protein
MNSNLLDLLPLIHDFLYIADHCNATLVVLGVNPPPNVPITGRRQILMDYLGAAMLA